MADCHGVFSDREVLMKDCARFLISIYNTAVMCLWRKQIKRFNRWRPFGTTADKLLGNSEITLWLKAFLCSQALNAWFNLASNSLDSYCCCVQGARVYRAQGNEKMSFSCSSVRPPPESRGYSHFRFKDKIIRGRFVEGGLHLNRIKVQCRAIVALQDEASVYFLLFRLFLLSTEVNIKFYEPNLLLWPQHHFLYLLLSLSLEF